MKLSTRSRYGVRILLELARQSDRQPLQVSVISRRQDIPVKYLEQLIRTLKKSGMITSVRGAKGGHILACDPMTISLGTIVSAPDICRMADDCRVRLAWKDATDALYERLDAITIADLLCEPPNPIRKIKAKSVPAS